MTRSTAGAALLTAIAAILLTGCGGQSTPSSAGQPLLSPPASPPPPSTTQVIRDAVASPVGSPSDVARELRNQALAPTHAVRSSTAPTSSLRQPPVLPDVRGVVVRQTWWRIDQPAGAAYRWVARHQSPLLKPIGSSSTGGPRISDRSQVATFTERHHLPPTVTSAQLSIEVVPVSSHSSAIGAFAVVVRQPIRPVSELVPLTVRTVSIQTVRTAHRSASSGPPDTGRRTLTGAAARQVVRDFDALRVMPPGGVYACPLEIYGTTVTFHATGHTWRAESSSCGGIAVTVNGRRLPALQDSNSFGRDLSKVERLSPHGRRSLVAPPVVVGTTTVIPALPVPVPTLHATNR